MSKEDENEGVEEIPTRGNIKTSFGSEDIAF